MNRAAWFAGGVAVGLLVGSRIGREPYDRVVGGARRAWENPHVQDTARLVQERAAHLYGEGRRRFSSNDKSGQEDVADSPDADVYLDRATAP